MTQEHRGPDAWRCGVAVALALLGGYAGAFAWMTWPLAARLGTHVAAPYPIFDILHSVWMLGWETHALTTAPSTIADANIYHPTPLALFYGPTAFGALLLYAPVFVATGSVLAAMNTTFLLGVSLGAWGAHLVVARWTRSHLAGAVSGVAFLTSTQLWWDTAGSYLSVLAAMPWIVALVVGGASSRRQIAALAMLVALQGSIDPMHYMLAVAAPIAVLVALDLRRRETRGRAVRIGLGLLGGIVLLAPVYVGYAAVARANPGIEQQSAWSGPGVTSLTWADSLWLTIGSRWWPWGRPGVLSEAWDTWGRLSLCLLGAAAVRRLDPPARRGARAALVWTLVGLSSYVLNLPPIKGVLLPWCPPARMIMRLAAGALVGLPLLLGLAIDAVGRALPEGRWRAPGRALLSAGVVGVLVLRMSAAMHATYPTAAVDGPPQPILAALRNGRGPLLELPASDVGAVTTSMYRSTLHWRPLVTGYSSYWPARYPDLVALAERLPDRDALETLHRTTQVDLVLVRLTKLPPTVRTAWLDGAAVKASGLDLVTTTPSELLFIVSAQTRLRAMLAPLARRSTPAQAEPSDACIPGASSLVSRRSERRAMAPASSRVQHDAHRHRSSSHHRTSSSVSSRPRPRFTISPFRRPMLGRKHRT